VLLLPSVAGALAGGQKADLVRVDKGRGRLYLERDGEVFGTFQVSLGKTPRGHKQQQGDGRTPEGRYVLDYKNASSRYYKSIHVSYPNAKDRESARQRGVDPGGDIMIHGQPNGKGWLGPISQLFNWTDGCIALRNKDMDVVWEAVDPGTPIEITP
jgi:murein L,D-transpeptidase YafK